MKCSFLQLAALIFLSESVISSLVTDSNSLVVSSTESTKEENEKELVDNLSVNPQIYSMQINANVSHRFVTALITSKVRNVKKNAEETTFSVILPENAFISAFEMEIGGKVYKAYVKEKEEAKRIYQEAVSRGQSAAHVELSARDSKTFTVSVNIEPESKTIFRLTYEELLQRQNGQYELIINIHPGQPVKDLGVQIHINESRPLTFVRTPSLRTGNEISKNDKNLDPSADIQIVNSSSAIVKFNPDILQQKTFAENLGSKKENGLAGQFVVQYDVERDPQGGEVLVRDGYFVHFFAPSELKPLPKHVVFVLDHSGSMDGRKIDQLIEAMQNILSELKTQDLFDIVRFSSQASVWSVDEDKFVTVNSGSYNSYNYGRLEPHLREANLPGAAIATEENIEKAKNVVKDKSDMGATNIIAGLEVGLFLIKRTQENDPGKYQPMIIFLTDGLPNVGMSSTEQITNTVTTLNSGENRTAVFSLSFGNEADKSFLKKLSSKNLGFSRHIYEAADASLQLQDFYSKISSPLLNNVTFKYVEGISEVTKTHYPIFFDGSELVVAGKISDTPDILPRVEGKSIIGPLVLNATRTEPVSSLERLWAYLTVKELLKEKDSATNSAEVTKKALDLSLKYSFVTEVSSLVVVKPNQTNTVDSGDRPVPPVQRQGRIFVMGSTIPRIGGGPSVSLSRFFIGEKGYRPHFGFGSSYDDFDARRPHFHRAPTPTRGVTTARPLATTTSPIIQNSTVPSWLDHLIKNNENITTVQGIFKLGQTGTVTTHPDCSNAPNNGTGVCTLIVDCPKIFPVLININVYLQHFCPLNEFAGVCCPQKQNTVLTS